MVEEAGHSMRAAPPACTGERTAFASAIEDIISIRTGKSERNALARVFGE